jgi:hypothetical protein
VTKAAFARAVAERLGLNEQAMREDLGIKRPVLAPLEPDAFMRWAWTGERKGSQPLTIDSLAFQLGGECSREDIHRYYVSVAARVRRNQRLGRGPWEDVS